MGDGDVDLYGDDIDPTFSHQDHSGGAGDLYDDVIAGATSAAGDSNNMHNNKQNSVDGNHLTNGSSIKRFQIYVGNLTWWTTDQDVIDAIRSLGVTDVYEVKFHENRANGQSKGFCVVSLNSEQSMQICLEHLSKKELQGQRPVVTQTTKNALAQFESQSKTRPVPSTQQPPPPQAGAPLQAAQPQGGQQPTQQPMLVQNMTMIRPGMPNMSGPPQNAPMQMGMAHRVVLLRPPDQMQGGPRMPPNMPPQNMPPQMMQQRMAGPPQMMQRMPPTSMPNHQGPPPGFQGLVRPNMQMQGMPNRGPLPQGLQFQGPPPMQGLPRGPPPQQGHPQMIQDMRQGPPRPEWNRPPQGMPQMSGPGFPQGPPPMTTQQMQRGPPPGHMAGPPMHNMQPQMQQQPPPMQMAQAQQQQQQQQQMNQQQFFQQQTQQQQQQQQPQPQAQPQQQQHIIAQPPFAGIPPAVRPPQYAAVNEPMHAAMPVPAVAAAVMSDQEFEEIMGRNRTVSSSAITRAVADAAAGDYASSIETLVTAISLIKQSKVAGDDRCKILISSLQDTLHGIEAKSYGNTRRERSRSRERERSHRRRRERSRSAHYRDRSRERDRDSHRDRYYDGYVRERSPRSRDRERERERERDYRDRSHDDSTSRQVTRSRIKTPPQEILEVAPIIPTKSSGRYYDDRYRERERDRDRERERERETRHGDRERDRDRRDERADSSHRSARH